MTRNFLVLFFVLLGVGCTPQCEKSNFEPSKPIGNPLPDFKIEELKRGEGPILKENDVVLIHYRGWIFDTSRSDKKGSIIGDTYSFGKPLKVKYGINELIEGWTEGLRGLRFGGKRRLFIPSTMAYGNAGAGNSIPKGTNLIYEIELLHSDQSPY